jgi:hypothetical protein
VPVLALKRKSIPISGQGRKEKELVAVKTKEISIIILFEISIPVAEEVWQGRKILQTSATTSPL